MSKLKYQCPSCCGSQFRFSMHNVTSKNPHGALCIFCKSIMTVSFSLLPVS
ncbi:cold shock small protein YmcF [Pantoea agglomerans]